MPLKHVAQLPKSYLLCAFLRVFLTCLPQTGYIHPDEYFQSIEPLAEKSLNVKVNKPWEFNVTFPLRSVTPLYFTTGLSFQILKLVDTFLTYQFDVSLATPYFTILFPRLLMTGLSFAVDWSLYRICLANSEKCKSRCLILSTSYVTLVYATRTFSNVIELLLFALLLYYVAESLIFSNINIRQREYINKRYKAAETLGEKAKFHKLRLYLENDSLRSYFTIATIVTVGFFNRPTFVAYAISPVFFWLYRGIGFKSIVSLQFHLRTVVFVASTVPTVVFFVVVDSFFYGYLTWGEIGMLEVSINNFVVTPWNFVKYNINAENLAEHGVHPRWLNMLVNVPLLFGVLAFLCYSNLVELLRSIWQCKYHHLPSVRSIRGLMTASILFPLALLSFVPHQEPRFLLPLILPLVYLYGPSIWPEQVDVVVKPTDGYKPGESRRREPNSLLKAECSALSRV
ncbi:GPI mannosyltransferase 4 isoform X2 [Photinus pyralis]|uniref:Mannosyltransferase n=1 Tax=Photinus pyralis TaxID=7054 RepID=A0A1Y1KQZ3_PHOPY|nr:GPI mannosyltransferase 4 isoform X2 [Photinus pyralis]